MRKFFVRRVENKGSTVLAMFDDKNTALEEGKRIFDSIPEKCMVDCIAAEADEQGNIKPGLYYLYKAWW